METLCSGQSYYRYFLFSVGLIQNGVWQFNEQYIVGIKFFGLPLEEILFFITIPYACTFIYESVLLFIKKQVLPNSIKPALILISILSLIASPFHFNKAYTFSVLFIGGIVFLVMSLALSVQLLEKFIITYLISIIPMFLVNGVLTALPVVIYNNTQNIGVRIGTIPVEDFAYSAILLAMNIGLYEWYRARENSNRSFKYHNGPQQILSN
jgi:lycopene cyclase domain-containing protein